mmetsp:Transcript_3946/g.8482  ORF Transcript_3946/g.8482 Transcript_3946/m.8482 type:complete len:219 (+) Transcript_3946:1144-1800(+)
MIDPFSQLRIFVIIQWNQSGPIVVLFVANKTLVHFHPLILLYLKYVKETSGFEKFLAGFTFVTTKSGGLLLSIDPFSQLRIFAIVQWDQRGTIVMDFVANKILVHVHPCFIRFLFSESIRTNGIQKAPVGITNFGSSLNTNPFSQLDVFVEVQWGPVVIVYIANKTVVHFHPLSLLWVTRSFKTNLIQKVFASYTKSCFSLSIDPFSKLRICVVVQRD